MAEKTVQQASKTIQIQYFALLREERGLTEEIVMTEAETVSQLYEELRNRFQFRLSTDRLNVAINNRYVLWDTVLNTGDHVVFLPPVAGG